MADNITAPATGAVLATDDVGGIQFPRVKVSWGIDGTAVDVSATNPLPVALTGTVAVSNALGATAAKQDLLLTATNLIVTAVQDTTPAAVTQSGTWSFGLTGTLPAFAATPTFNLGTLNGAATAANQTAMQATLDATYALQTAGYSLTGGTYAAPTGVTIAAGAAGPTVVTLLRSGYYALDASFTGTSPSLKVQILGVDGTWLDVVTRTVSGAASDPIQFPAGAQIRLFNASAGSLTAVKGRIS